MGDGKKKNGGDRAERVRPCSSPRWKTPEEKRRCLGTNPLPSLPPLLLPPTPLPPPTSIHTRSSAQCVWNSVARTREPRLPRELLPSALLDEPAPAYRRGKAVTRPATEMPSSSITQLSGHGGSRWLGTGGAPTIPSPGHPLLSGLGPPGAAIRRSLPLVCREGRERARASLDRVRPH